MALSFRLIKSSYNLAQSRKSTLFFDNCFWNSEVFEQSKIPICYPFFTIIDQNNIFIYSVFIRLSLFILDSQIILDDSCWESNKSCQKPIIVLIVYNTSTDNLWGHWKDQNGLPRFRIYFRKLFDNISSFFLYISFLGDGNDQIKHYSFSSSLDKIFRRLPVDKCQCNPKSIFPMLLQNGLELFIVVGKL